jgi:hypothetical protein
LKSYIWRNAVLKYCGSVALRHNRIAGNGALLTFTTTGEKMEITMNITFPRVPCELLTLDVMDVSGEMQMGVMHGISKVRLSPSSEGSKVIESKALEL